MVELGPAVRPPAPIETERLVLRASEARDRAAVIELFASPQVGQFIGGAQPRDVLEESVPEIPGRRPGFFVVELGGAMIGTVTLDRRDAERRGHVADDSGAPWLGYLFLSKAWGHGYAKEASAAVLEWFADEVPGESVVLCTQSANEPSMRLAAALGFVEVERFEQWDAEQWFGIWSRSTSPGSGRRG
ncbi:GNAT family N-acetyltransferase [Nocardioides aurantiacus]|uniref:RimJ/RimL family protein N-acetyltransferase n=1 Tax=Nocardioides aurantiacus TaxID=86796 RepID=A0A3N2CTS8_9ACTN|nr:GNAT family N-acetyltransferase [Nocardioides aurantiacus]ROR90943.1 RimJ/RimL family protein N-acetyltransferase [Nocardioides aurantiacus]